MNSLINRCLNARQSLKGIKKCFYATDFKDSIVSDLEVEEVPIFEEQSKYTEEQLYEIRNKSRLNKAHRNILNDEKPYNEPQAIYHNSIWYKKKMLGKYGIEASGFSPGICWPTKEDIDDVKEYEKVAYPISIQELWKQIEERKKEEAIQIKKREEEIDKVVANFDKWKAELAAKIAKKEADLLKAKEKKERFMEEIREQLGYTVDPRDERFKLILEQKEKEDRKKKKEEKKKERQQKILTYLQKTAENIKAESEDTKQSNETNTELKLDKSENIDESIKEIK